MPWEGGFEEDGELIEQRLLVLLVAHQKGASDAKGLPVLSGRLGLLHHGSTL
jgi:hypothetical protein